MKSKTKNSATLRLSGREKKELKMKNNEILLTGGSGLLGTEIQKNASDIIAPNHKEFDITDFEQMNSFINEHKNINTIIHGAAFTSPPLIEKDPIKAIETNIIGTANVVKICVENNLRLVYISTDYVYKGDKGQYSEEDGMLPQNKYAWSKLGGETAVKLYDNSLIIRTSFCESVFPYDKAFIDQYTSRDSVTVIAPMIFKASKNVSLNGILNIGTERKTVKELAIKLGKTDVGGLKRNDVGFDVPYDTSFDLKKYQKNK